jgi:cytochrome c-type biogenesis protein CcmH
MRAEIRRRLVRGETPAQIEAFFVDKYGESILLSPRSAAPWVVPILALAGGIALLAWVLRRRRSDPSSPEVGLSPGERALIRREVEALEEPD